MGLLLPIYMYFFEILTVGFFIHILFRGIFGAVGRGFLLVGVGVCFG